MQESKVITIANNLLLELELVFKGFKKDQIKLCNVNTSILFKYLSEILKFFSIALLTGLHPPLFVYVVGWAKLGTVPKQN